MMFVDDILAFFLIPRAHTQNACLKESQREKVQLLVMCILVKN